MSAVLEVLVLAVIDIGNSNIVFGVYENEVLTHRFRISTNHKATSDEYGNLLLQMLNGKGLALDKISAVVISSVVPQLDATFERLCVQYFLVAPLVIGKDLRVNLPLLVDRPKEVGADRIVNAYAAFQKYRQSMILVDLGTATTFDVVNNAGEYLGGAIAPGVEIASDALFRLTSKIQRVDLKIPQTAIGKNTETAVQSGVFWGYLGLIDSLVRRMKAEIVSPVKVIATGGLAKIFAGTSTEIEIVEEDLTLNGLYLIYNENSRRL